MASHAPGQAVRIVRISGKQLELDIPALEAILMGPECRDRSICIVSIAGAFRKGKSFMLNLFLKYLQAEVPSEWLKDDESPLQGFSWKGGSVRDTTGMLLWSTPFVVKGPDGREVAVLLMDTQGSFDGQHTLANTAAIFAVSTLTCSVQVYNLSKNIQDDDLQNLQLFAEYGRLALEESREQPFQKLLFLVRDWEFPEYEYGIHGGKQFLEAKLAVTEERTGELEQVRVNLRAVFQEMECFPMPHPGKKVARSVAFDGRLRDIDPEFVDQLKVLVPHLLHSETIITKKINGQEVTGSDLFVYFKAYVNTFTSGDLMKPEYIMKATARANNQTALSKAREYYKKRMDEAFSASSLSMSEEESISRHAQYLERATKKFNSQKKMGGSQMSEAYLDKLKAHLDNDAKQYLANNRFKRLTEEHAKKSEELKQQMDNLEEQYDELERVRQREREENTIASRELRQELERKHQLSMAQNARDVEAQRQRETELRGMLKKQTDEHARKSEEIRRTMSQLEKQNQDLKRARERDQQENSAASRELREQLERKYQLTVAQNEEDVREQKRRENELRAILKKQADAHVSKNEELKKQMNKVVVQCQDLEEARRREQEENSTANRELREQLEEKYQLSVAQNAKALEVHRQSEGELRAMFTTAMSQNGQLQAQLRLKDDSCTIL